MTYALSTLWYERQRFFAAILAVAFSTVLICIQVGLLLGMFALTSIPVDHAKADIWVGGPDIVSVDIGRPIPDSYLCRLANHPEVETAEIYVLGFSYWTQPDGASELVILVGSRLTDDSIGAVSQLTPELRSQLTEPMAIVVDKSELGRLGIKGVGEIAEINKKRVRVVGLIEGLSGLQGPYVFCSIHTARKLLRLKRDQGTYVLGTCRTKEEVKAVVNRLQKYPNMSVLTQSEFSLRSRWHWLTKTKAGIAMGFAAALGLLVGAVVTRQSLYSATIAMLRELAVLRAMGIPRWRVAANITSLAFLVGLSGIVLAVPTIYLLLHVGSYLHVPILMPWWLLAGGMVITWTVAIIAGLTTLHSLGQVEPMTLLR